MDEAEAEYRNLEAMISIMESKLIVAAPDEKQFLSNAVDNMRTRLEDVQKKMKDKQEQDQLQRLYNADIAKSVSQETRLSMEEKQEFGNFLQKEFFTKRDFTSLDKFYSKTYDRLSEHGKDQMDHRVWEGVRRNEYKFSDLPDSVKERTSSRIYRDITKGDDRTSNISQIPEQDKSDFINAYQAGDKKKVDEVLDRDSFKKNISVRETAEDQTKSKETGKDKSAQAVLNNTTHTSMGTEEQRSSVSNKKALLEKHLSNAGLDGMTDASLAENKTAPTVKSASVAQSVQHSV